MKKNIMLFCLTESGNLIIFFSGNMEGVVRMLKKVFWKIFLLILIIFLQITLILQNSLPLKSAQIIKLRGLTTATIVFGQPILTCDCTVTEDLDCSCIIIK